MNTDNNRFSLVLEQLDKDAALYAIGETSKTYNEAPSPDFVQLAKNIYMAGASRALECQWLPYPEHDLPEDIEYVIRDSKGNSYVIPEWMLKKTVKEDYDVVAWLPLPIFNISER